MIISVNAGKPSDKIQLSFNIKSFRKTGIENFLHLILRLIMKHWMCSPYDQEQAISPLSLLSLRSCWRAFSATRQEKEMKGIQIRKEDIKLSLFTHDY